MQLEDSAKITGLEGHSRGGVWGECIVTRVASKMLETHVEQNKLYREYISDRAILLSVKAALRRACGGLIF